MPTSELLNRLIIPPRMEQVFPEYAYAVRTAVQFPSTTEYAKVNDGTFPDGSPNINIVNTPKGSSVVIPSFISGPYALEMLGEVSRIGFTLTHSSRIDRTSPRADKVVGVFSAFEGRGDKRTRDRDGNDIEEAELRMAEYIGANLREIAGLRHIYALDPHSARIKAFIGGEGQRNNRQNLVTALSALGPMGEYMHQRGIISGSNWGVVIADGGAVARSMHFAREMGLPIVARMVKERREGKARVVDVYGADNIGKGISLILVDDMVASGGTLDEDATMLRSLGAEDNIVAVTPHVIGVPGARARIGDMIDRGIIQRLIVTNSNPGYRTLLRESHNGTRPQPINGVDVVDILSVLGQVALAELEGDPAASRVIERISYPLRSYGESLGALNKIDPRLAPDFDSSRLQDERVLVPGFVAPARFLTHLHH